MGGELFYLSFFNFFIMYVFIEKARNGSRVRQRPIYSSLFLLLLLLFGFSPLFFFIYTKEKKQREESERRKQYQAEASAMTDHKGIEDRKIYKELEPLVLFQIKHSMFVFFMCSSQNE